MNKCIHCYQPLDGESTDYHPWCIQEFFGATEAPQLPYDLSEMDRLAKEAIKKSVSVPGVQPKISLGFLKEVLEDAEKNRLTIYNALDGFYILKPPNSKYPQMPENEHLSMMLASAFSMSIVPFSMIRLQSGELCYITRRIDRKGDEQKIHMIDFMQILELDDKYTGTMEQLGRRLGRYRTIY
ncbi:HipA domain-containing protein [Niabella hibiscisoli]|nr:HipA domain-containing protein [Niabella hibiscisoli]MCH5719207.1 HipA domain-containing protein [Niabella hibiscisoli]